MDKKRIAHTTFLLSEQNNQLKVVFWNLIQISDKTNIKFLNVKPNAENPFSTVSCMSSYNKVQLNIHFARRVIPKIEKKLLVIWKALWFKNIWINIILYTSI